ncbi:DUF2815 family protein [Enterobacter huaxiensis]|uniref:DUF2815 family protein n=1 Tax=Enterobacter huaxiensis TaxID=2494702 RepID=UPI00217611B8|nr:DUF2815 family protein [Enterobacter huaxiensis]MCS5452528.1 DUF2815 family protein [Enterobacter huaxiensis]
MFMKLNNVRLSFPDLFVSTQINGEGDKKFRGTFLIAKDHPQIKEVEAEILRVVELKWPGKGESIIQQIRNNPMRFCLRDGETKDYEGYAGNMFISASNKTRPLTIDADKSFLTEEDGKLYSGAWVNVAIEFYAYDNSGKGVAASLRGVQFAKHGDAFAGGTPASADDFDDCSIENEFV